MSGDFPPRHRVAWLTIAFEASLAGVAWVVGWLVGQPPFAHFRWDGRDAALGVAATVPLLLVLLLLVHRPVGPFRRIRQFFEEVVRPLFGPCTRVELALIALAAGLGEEMLFRGVLQEALSSWLGPWAGLAVSSLLFGLLHPITAWYVVIAALFGVYLGGVYRACDNLLAVIITHALYDFLALVYLLRRPKAT
jgi:membrane protease YdiL (CAAX protease family)